MPSARLLAQAKARQQHSGQDGDDDQQFDERKGWAWLPGQRGGRRLAARTQCCHVEFSSLMHLHSFCEVCRLGGFAAAARRLNLTSPAVWEQVRALEG